MEIPSEIIDTIRGIDCHLDGADIPVVLEAEAWCKGWLQLNGYVVADDAAVAALVDGGLSAIDALRQAAVDAAAAAWMAERGRTGLVASPVPRRV